VLRQDLSRRALLGGILSSTLIAPVAALSQPTSTDFNLATALSEVRGGAYRYIPVSLDSRLRVPAHIIFSDWELQNRVYTETNVTRNTRTILIYRIEPDGRFESNTEHGLIRGQFFSNGRSWFEGSIDGRHYTGRSEILSDGRRRTSQLINGRLSVFEMEMVPEDEALRIAARLYPAEFGQIGRSEDRDRPAPAAGRRRALVIGTGDYTNLPDLPNPPNDARIVARTLTGLGYRVDLILDAERDAIVGALSRFRAEGSETERSAEIFYYAGHAVEVRGRNFLLGTDMPMRPVDIESEAVPVDLVLDHFRGGRRSTRIIILDACRNGPSRLPGMGQGLAQLSAPQGTYVAYSTAPGMVATDGDGRNSPFTSALVNELERPRQPIEAVFRGVRRAVVNSTGGQQIPWDSSSLIEPFYFADR
jgi:hypothetical protein